MLTQLFNAPFSLDVKTNIGKEFFRLVDHIFTVDHPYYRIFNRKTIKLSYSCMENMESIIKSHNTQILRQSEASATEPPKLCNCRKADCPMQGNCLKENVIYKATVKSSGKEMDYIGSTGRSFKARFYEHSHALRHRSSPHNTTLSEYVWSERSRNEDPRISWTILHNMRVPNAPQRICTTCNLEKMEIAATNRRRSLNKRSEMTGKCRHFAKFYF